MSDKNFNPSWEGYMGDFLKGNVGINQLKPQHEFLDTIGLEKALSDCSAAFFFAQKSAKFCNAA
ncbi:TPA: hypothetical protein KNH08_002011 [Serratia fonticola]|nr:hypothetical protein [Serratia fonticola]